MSYHWIREKKHITFFRIEWCLFVKSWVPLHSRMRSVIFIWNWPSCSWVVYLTMLIFFCYYVIISQWNKALSFIYTHLYPHNPRILFANLVEIGPVVKKISKKLSMYCVALHLNILDFPLPKMICAKFGWNLVQWFWIRRFFKFCQCAFDIT